MADTVTVDQPATTVQSTDDGFGDVTTPAASDQAASTTTTDDKPAAGGDQSKAEGTKAPEESKPDDEAARKAHNEDMARQRIAEREQRKTQEQISESGDHKTDDTDKVASPDEPADANDFLNKLEEDISEELAQVEDQQDRRLKSIEARQYLGEARQATERLVFEHERVQADIPLFNPDNPDFNKDAYEYFIGQYEAAHTSKDSNGVIWPKQSLYQFMKGAEQLLGTVAQKGALKGQQAEANMRAKADVPSGKSERKNGDDDDPFLKGFLGK